jgi:hypothetical protein
MWDNFLSWWQNIDPETRSLSYDGALAVGALLVGYIVGKLAARVLRAWRFDTVFRVSTPGPDFLEDGRRITPSMLVGLLVRLSVWAGAAWWLAGKHGHTDVANTIAVIVARTWAVGGIVSAALAIAGLFSRRVIECFENNLPAPTPLAANRVAVPAAPAPRQALAGAVGAGVYGLVLLMVLLAVVDRFDLPLARDAAAALWQLTLHLLVVGSAVAVGVIGARWAREFSAPPKGATSADHVGQYTALGITAGTTALGVALLLFSSGLKIGMAALALAAIGLYFGWGHLPDLVAGLKLRRHNVGTIMKDGMAWQVARVGLFRSDVGREGQYFKVQNRHLLEVFAQNVPQAAGHSELMH